MSNLQHIRIIDELILHETKQGIRRTDKKSLCEFE